MQIKQLTQTDNFKISIKIKIKDAKCFHKRVYICGSLLCHLRAGSFLHHFITPCGLLLFRSIGLPMGNSFTYLGRFRHYAGRDIPHQQAILGQGTVFILSLLRAATSFSLVIAYQNIASGVASTIHFMYPLAVALAMMGFFGEKRSFAILFAVLVSLSGAGLLSSGKIDFEGGNTTIGLIAAGLSVFFYGGYIVGVRKSRAVQIPSTALTCYVMGLGALFFIIGGYLTGGIRLANDTYTWLNILGLALPATAISNITLVKAIKYIGPTLTSIFGALEPLTAVVIGCLIFNESFTPASAIGMALIITGGTVVVVHEKKKESES